jgi:hypothetical protein
MNAKIRFAIVAATLAAATGGLVAAGAIAVPIATSQVQLQAAVPNATGTALQGQVGAVNENPRNGF